MKLQILKIHNISTAAARRAALKAWVTIRKNKKKLSDAGKKAWATRVRNARKNK